ncbi:MAG TPA: tyrosine-type recombinase/integrase, partial [Bacteroidia bacterium]|nr:tyrosine-type recombinase/integrase [Bacteroidia bacterium]
KDILIDDITITFLEDFEAHHLSLENKLNGISAYLRAVRSITNKAVKEILKNKRYENYPWAGGYTIKTEKTKPRPVRMEVIEDIRKIKLEKGTAAWNAQNYLLFMFNNRGINFIDVAKLTKNKIENAHYVSGKLIDGRLKYKRSKTDVETTVKLTKESLRILNDYNIFGKENDEFVFPIGYVESKTGRETYSQKRKRINSAMTQLAVDAGHPNVPVTTYTLRYTFGTELRRQGFGLDVVQEALAQSDSRSAQIYTENYEESVLDRVTEMIVMQKSKKLSNSSQRNRDNRVSVYPSTKKGTSLKSKQLQKA